MLIIVPMKGFCFKGIHPRRRMNPVITPANPILTFINLLKPSWKTSHEFNPKLASIVNARPKPHKNKPNKS